MKRYLVKDGFLIRVLAKKKLGGVLPQEKYRIKEGDLLEIDTKKPIKHWGIYLKGKI